MKGHGPARGFQGIASRVDDAQRGDPLLGGLSGKGTGPLLVLEEHAVDRGLLDQFDGLRVGGMPAGGHPISDTGDKEKGEKHILTLYADLISVQIRSRRR